ncbi:glycosyltransferase [uncultured Salinibacterium sp.]|uniref:glycosyltransferase n=1 Tax=uncultured Salinibacterium sp. TaxID=459274 RepID=UPI0030DB71EB|tara:strand:+ start:92656 stop:93777 length:1122 start_codon:yes stop_codon:yes gene_type:complete
MHIAHVTSFYAVPALAPSSAVRSRGLAYRAAGHEFTVIVPGTEPSVTWAEYGTVVTVPARGRALARGFVPVAKAIRRALEKLVPDQIEVADRLSARELGAWALSSSVPAIFIVDTPLEEAFSSHSDVAGYDRVVSVSPHPASDPVTAGPHGGVPSADRHSTSTTLDTENPMNAPDGVNLEVFSPLRHNSGLRDSSDADLVLLCATPLTSAGQPALAIDLIRRMTASGKDVHLVILGDGPLRSRLERSSAELPVQFLSARDLELDERAEVFATADIALVTTGGHAGHAIALEALATGTPVVNSHTRGIPIAFVSGGGLTVEPELSHIEHAIRVLGEEPVENRRDAARSTAVSFDSIESERAFINLHESLHRREK